MDFLLNYDFSESDIEEIKQRYNEATISDLICNKENVIKNIIILKGIGIKNVNELLIQGIEVFQMSPDYLKNKLKQVNIKNFVLDVNEDFGVFLDLF